MEFIHKVIFQILICSIILIFSYFDESFSIILAILYGLVLMWKAELPGFLGLFILYLTKYNFYYVGDYKSMENIGINKERFELLIFSFPIDLPTLVCFTVPFRVIFENFKDKSTYEKYRKLFFLWLCILFPAIAMFILSYSVREPNWTRGFRFLLTVGSFFYGLILAKNVNRSNIKYFFLTLSALSFVVIVLMNLHIFWSHLSFLFLGFSSSFSLYLLFRGNAVYKCFGIIFTFLTWNLILNSTFTVLLIGIISSLVFFQSYRRSFLEYKKHRQMFSKYVFTLYILGFLILFFPFLIIGLGDFMGINIYYFEIADDNPLKEKLLAKILLDRYPFWKAAYTQIMDGPIFFVPSGRPLLVNSLSGDFNWIYGAHNVVLEVIRNDGFLVGLCILFLIGSIVLRLTKVLFFSQNLKIIALISAVLGVTLSGIITGDFPVDMIVGFSLWALFGLIIVVSGKSELL